MEGPCQKGLGNPTGWASAAGASSPATHPGRLERGQLAQRRGGMMGNERECWGQGRPRRGQPKGSEAKSRLQGYAASAGPGWVPAGPRTRSGRGREGAKQLRASVSCCVSWACLPHEAVVRSRDAETFANCKAPSK